MRNAIVLTKSNEKQITEDWQRALPSLGIYRPRHLLRRIGPMLMGICLDRDSGGEIYKPIFHVHCMCTPDDSISLMLGTQLRSDRSGGPDFIQVRFHEDKYKEAAARMVRQSLLPLAGDLRLEQVMDACRHYLSTPMGKFQAAILYRDMILLSAWAGDRASASKLVAECLRLERQTDLASDDAAFRHLGGRAAFEADCRKLIENPALIQQTVDSQIAALGVEHLPVSKLLP